jgi:outer membrane protein TolC
MITGGYDWNYTPAAGNVNGWYGLATLRWNIFNGFEKKYRVQAAIINQEASESGIQEAELNIQNEMNIQLINLNEAKSQIHVTEKWMQNTFENLASAEAQYRAGTGSMLELTDARVKNLTAKQNHIKAITTYLITIANIERLTGNTIKNANE